jgi:hypothetical protein
MTTKQLVALVASFLLLGMAASYFLYGNILATPCFH